MDQTNALPRLIMITLKVSDRADATRADEVITQSSPFHRCPSSRAGKCR